MKFPILKLIDYKYRIKELSESKNLFAFIVLSYILSLEHPAGPINNYSLGRKLIRGFIGRGYSTGASVDILRFIDAVIIMPGNLRERLWQEIEKEQGNERMTHYLPFEIRAMKRGEEVGEQRGRQEGEQRAYIKAIKAFLSTRFGRTKAAPAIEALYRIEDANALEALLEVTCKAKSLDEVLANYSKVKRSTKAKTSKKSSNGTKARQPSKR